MLYVLNVPDSIECMLLDLLLFQLNLLLCSCVGVWVHDRVEIIPNDQGNRTTPSYVAFTDTERLCALCPTHLLDRSSVCHPLSRKSL